tara:strand:+ start:288 stop:521 length:234 start_codon:yes stop_codon:yes gene_type:complete
MCDNTSSGGGRIGHETLDEQPELLTRNEGALCEDSESDNEGWEEVEGDGDEGEVFVSLFTSEKFTSAQALLDHLKVG